MLIFPQIETNVIYWKLKKRFCRQKFLKIKFSVWVKVSLRPRCWHIHHSQDGYCLLSHSVHSCSSSPPCLCVLWMCWAQISCMLQLFTVDIHINYPDCQEPTSGSFAPSAFLLLAWFACVRARVFLFVFGWLNIPVYTLEQDEWRKIFALVYVMESHSLDLHARVRVVGAGEDNSQECYE